jgi:hypothetical protein
MLDSGLRVARCHRCCFELVSYFVARDSELHGEAGLKNSRGPRVWRAFRALPALVGGPGIRPISTGRLGRPLTRRARPAEGPCQCARVRLALARARQGQHPAPFPGDAARRPVRRKGEPESDVCVPRAAAAAPLPYMHLTLKEAKV